MVARSTVWFFIAAALAGCGKSDRDDESGTGGHAGTTHGGTAGATAGSGATSGRGASGGTGGQAGSGANGGTSGAGGKGGKQAGGTAGSMGGTASGMGGRATGGSAGAGAGGTGNGGMGNGGQATGGADGGAAGEADLGPLGGLIEAFCATARACCPGAGQPAQALEHCEDSFLAQSYNVSLVAAGKVTIDSTALGTCIAAYQQAATSCVIDGIEDACHGILIGSVADGGDCTDVAECDRNQGAKVCQKFIDGGDVGTCQTPPRGENGDPCSISCAVGANCSVTSVSPDDSYPTTLCYEADGLFCRPGYSCMPLVSYGDYCTGSDACGSDGFCNGDTCDALLAPGADCSFGPMCGHESLCENGHCVAMPFANTSSCVGYPPSFD